MQIMQELSWDVGKSSNWLVRIKCIAISSIICISTSLMSMIAMVYPTLIIIFSYQIFPTLLETSHQLVVNSSFTI